MKYIGELKVILSQQLNWHKSRVDCFAQMLLALFIVRTVNLSEIAVAMEGSKASIDSRYKRIQDFSPHLNLILLALLVGYMLCYLTTTKRSI